MSKFPVSRSLNPGSSPNFRELFTPKLVTVLREGYGLAQLRADAIAGLTVAIVALPLSMAIAIASGVSPDRGVYTAIVGGFLVSLLGGSRFQIGGPAGAFIILVAASVQRHGIDGLVLATAMSGVMLMIVGYLRLGTYIKFIPYPVTVGFTAGIAVIIFASQLRDLFGLSLDGPEPGALIEKLGMLASVADTLNPQALLVALGTIAIIVIAKRLRPNWPGMLIAIAFVSIAATLLTLDVETIGSRFGGIPRTLPLPALPEFSLGKAQAVLPDAIAFTLLGAIESLLSAVVADGMTGRRHRSNCELVAQGVANIGAAFVGGVPVTGTIARTATNVRSGSVGPVSGLLHAVFLLLFMLIAAPLASYIPLAALAGLLAVVAWNMVEKSAISSLLRSSWGDAAVVSITFLLVIFRDLTEGIVVGFALGALLFIHRMATTIVVEEDVPDSAETTPAVHEAEAATQSNTSVYRVSGAFFFGAAATVGTVLDGIIGRDGNFVLDFSKTPLIDSTAANVVEGVARKAQRAGVRMFITGTSPSVRQTLIANGVRAPLVTYEPTVAAALEQLRNVPLPSSPY